MSSFITSKQIIDAVANTHVILIVVSYLDIK